MSQHWPWRIVGEREQDGTPYIEITQGDRLICAVVADEDGVLTHEDWANARKIISAPELTARCERLLKALKAAVEHPDEPMADAAFHRACAAIAGAEEQT